MSRVRPSSSVRAALEDGILVAAEAVFAERGFDGATTAEIALRAGIPKSNLHYYFPTKTDLYRRVLKGVLEAWLSAADRFEGAADPADALARYIGAKMDLARDRPQGSRIFASEILRGAPDIQDFLDTTLRQWVESRSAIVEQWIQCGALRAIEPKTLFYMIWATTQHYADFAHQIATLNDGRPLDPEAFARTKREVIDIILAGVLAKSAPAIAQGADGTPLRTAAR